MRKLSDTIARLSALKGLTSRADDLQGGHRLQGISGFGSNPGALKGWIYVPQGLADEAPLVVVLHGCTQTAAGYDVGAGWSEMADRHGFALLFPEQQRQNNPNLCFNWFSPEDNRRGAGEALSIRQMIAFVGRTHAIDPDRIYVTGLSAGGAMATVMLATYPEVFAGGAIIAGLPYGIANTVPQAFDRMRGHGLPGGDELAALVRNASDYSGSWPAISVWHGSGDATVNPNNADAVIRQWRSLHGVAVEPSRTEAVDGYPRRVWCDDEGREVIEEFSVTGMGHGTPLDTGREDACGRRGAYMLEASISSTHHICRFWGLSASAGDVAPRVPARARRAAPEGASMTGITRANEPRLGRARPMHPPSAEPNTAGGVGKVIEDALRAAGLVR